MIQKATKPSKPYPDFPLYAHASGLWAKRINGRIHYFGPWRDWQAALAKFQRERDDLYAGREPEVTEGVSVETLCDHFIDAKRRQVLAGELRSPTYQDYWHSCKRVVKFFGKRRAVESLRPSDFGKLREDMAKTLGPVRLGNEISRIRTLFRYAGPEESGLLEKPVRIGGEFRRPPKRVVRRVARESGPRWFQPAEVRALLRQSRGQLRAMVYLAINCGLGPRECGLLELADLDLDAGWLDHSRAKTEMPRRAKLWPATVRAIRRALHNRPTPRDPDLGSRIFITKYGRPWTHEADRVNPVSQEFAKLQDACGVRVKGRGFYCLRHSYRTAADECGDQPAINLTMGHVDPSMGGIYRHTISDSRLEQVATTVREWLGKPPER